MNLRKEDLPATLQAFELLDNKETFLAEQVVNSQSEIDTFTARYAGKLIKAKAEVPASNRINGQAQNVVPEKRRSSIGLVMVIIILILAALVIYGFSTGWIQEKLHWNI